MGFGIDDAVGGAASGGLYPAAKALGLFDKTTTSQQPLETPEQKASRQMLLNFAQTGRFGDFQAGAEVPLHYGDYRMTDAEQQGQSQLMELLRNGLPEQYKMGDAALRDLLATSPGALDAQFQPYKALADRQLRSDQAGFKRSAGYAGNLYSTAAIKGLGDLEARHGETLTQQLAQLTDNALNRRLQAIPLAYQSAGAQEQAALGRVSASQQYGDLARSLNDQSIKARDAELLRRRTELQLPIQAAESISGTPVPFGVPSVTTSPYQDLLALVGQVGGQYVAGKAFGAGLGGGRAPVPTPGAPVNMFTQ